LEGECITFSDGILMIKHLHYCNHLQYKYPTSHWYHLLQESEKYTSMDSGAGPLGKRKNDSLLSQNQKLMVI